MLCTAADWDTTLRLGPRYPLRKGPRFGVYNWMVSTPEISLGGEEPPKSPSPSLNASDSFPQISLGRQVTCISFQSEFAISFFFLQVYRLRRQYKRGRNTNHYIMRHKKLDFFSAPLPKSFFSNAREKPPPHLHSPNAFFNRRPHQSFSAHGTEGKRRWIMQAPSHPPSTPAAGVPATLIHTQRVFARPVAR